MDEHCVRQSDNLTQPSPKVDHAVHSDKVHEADLQREPARGARASLARRADLEGVSSDYHVTA